jgi:hypothetical protein
LFLNQRRNNRYRNVGERAIYQNVIEDGDDIMMVENLNAPLNDNANPLANVNPVNPLANANPVNPLANPADLIANNNQQVEQNQLRFFLQHEVPPATITALKALHRLDKQKLADFHNAEMGIMRAHRGFR